MKKLYMGIDIGTISTKGVIIDRDDHILASSYLYTEGNPIKTVKQVIKNMQNQIDLNKYQVVSVGTTGSARKLIGLMLSAGTIKNEIIAHAVGTLRIYPNAKTIFEIGGQDAKMTLINDGVVVDYTIKTPCIASSGSFITSLARRLGIKVEDIGEMALTSQNGEDVVARCTIFAELDLIHKIQVGYQKEDIISMVSRAIVTNYINNVAKDKCFQSPIVFTGGVSKNIAVVKAFEEITGKKIIVDQNSHLMGAFGIALLAKDSQKEKIFNFNIDELNIETKIINCHGCLNNCEIVKVYRNNKLIDSYGTRCVRGNLILNK